jgi:tetratricopeptide (TPR) repeat protein
LAANKRKILEAARKHAQKGAKDRALKEYEKLLKLDPRDAKLRLEVGDAHRRWDQIDQAVAAYSKVAEQYTKDGFDARAVAVYKQIQNLDPKCYDSYEPLAEVYQRMGLTAEAVGALQAAADGYHKNGKRREALDLLRKMAMLDPTNTTSRIKIADLLRQEELYSEAITEYEEASGELERQGDMEMAATVLERILEIQPKRVETLTRLARNLIAARQVERAEPFAKRAVENADEDVEAYELLAEVYREQRKDDELTEVYRSLADVYRRRGDEDKARDLMQRFVPVGDMGGSLDAEGMLGGEGTQGDAEPALLEDEVVEEVVLAEELLTEEVPSTGSDPDTSFADGPELEIDDDADLEAPLEEEEDDAPPITGDPDQLLAEASVYLRYGKRAQAIGNLEAILDLDPKHRAALEKLGEARADAGDSEEAVQAWLRAADVARGDGDMQALGVLRDRIAALDPEAAEPLLAETSGPVEEEIEAPEEPELEPAPDLSQESEEYLDLTNPGNLFSGDRQAEEIEAPEPTGALSSDDLEDLEIEVETHDEFEVSAGDAVVATPPGDPGASTSTPAQVGEDLEEADFYMQQGLIDEAEPIYHRILKAVPKHPQALLRLGEITAARGNELSDTLAEIEMSIDPPISAPPPESSEDLVIEDEPEVLEIEPEIDSEPEPEPEELDSVEVAPSPPVATEGDGSEPSFDLAAELSDALDDATPDVASGSDDGFAAVFSEFKKGVSKQLGEGDHEAHYDLGIAYREMGLLDDAVGEFRASMNSPARRIDSLHMLGLCTLAQQKPGQAVEYLEQALGASDLNEEQDLAIRFEVGRAFEQLGEVEKARDAWEAVVAVDPGFCEVEERLAELNEASKSGNTTSDTEEFESFGDLIDEANDDAGGASGDDEHESFDDLIAEANADENPDASGSRGGVDRDGKKPGKDGRGKKSSSRRGKRKISFV